MCTVLNCVKRVEIERDCSKNDGHDPCDDDDNLGYSLVHDALVVERVTDVCEAVSSYKYDVGHGREETGVQQTNVDQTAELAVRDQALCKGIVPERLEQDVHADDEVCHGEGHDVHVGRRLQ